MDEIIGWELMMLFGLDAKLLFELLVNADSFWDELDKMRRFA